MNQKSVFASATIVFLTWYCVAYVWSTGSIRGLIGACGLSAIALVVGGLVGAGITATSRFIELQVAESRIRSGDKRGGAILSLGKLPEIVPVVRHESPEEQLVRDDEVGPDATLVARDSIPPATTEPSDSDAVQAGQGEPEDDDEVSLLDSILDAENATVEDRLALAGRQFAGANPAIVVFGSNEVAEGAEGQRYGAITRESDTSAFDEFLEIVSNLADEGIDVSRVRISVGADDGPQRITFPIAAPDADDRGMHE